jgi:hypothetical protein
MKKPFYSITLLAIVFSVFTAACASNNEKVAEAKEELVEANKDLNEAQEHASESAAKAATVEEWKLFKIESETKIQNNKAEIARLKISLKKPGKELDAMYSESIQILEKRNKDLLAKMNDYETSQSDWATFRREFDYDMESMSKAIKDLGANNRQ